MYDDMETKVFSYKFEYECCIRHRERKSAVLKTNVYKLLVCNEILEYEEEYNQTTHKDCTTATNHMLCILTS